MPELLGKITRMKVEQVRDGTPVEADHVYVIPPNATLTLEGGILRVHSPASAGLRTPIDGLFHSLAEDQGHRAVCVLFSGSGSDGTLGLRSVKEHGGMAMAQSPQSARHDSILRSAIATGLVDHVLPPEEMPAKLVEYTAYLRVVDASRAGAGLFDERGDQLSQICALVRRKTGHDFSRYKCPTLVRRIERRMLVQQSASASAYLERLRKDPKEVEQLFRDLLIGVTRFFRDKEAFAVLARTVVPAILERAGPDGTLRVWTPGCATGEEAYSIAILLREEMARRGDAQPRVQIFAGDIDDEALAFARQARYPEGIAEHVSPERLERFFVRQGQSYQVAKDVREMCIFSTHNLIKDPPISRVDLVVCRNLLIYLENEPQRQVATLFHYALRPGGYLFLGPSESIVGPADLFRTLDKKHRVFQRGDTVALPAMLLPAQEAFTTKPAARPWTARVAAAGQGHVVADLERLLIDEYAPAWVIVNGDGESVYFSARTGRFLEPAVGTPSMDLVAMARRGLRLDLRSAIHKAVRTRDVVVHERVAVQMNGDVQVINLIVRPLGELGHDPGLFLVVFQEAGPPRPREPDAHESAPQRDSLVQQLESELRTTKEHLQATVEEVETSNEELKSSNEELLSTNEELQSANEELQTSKEELQSVNEELETINAELNKKVEELDHVNSDLYNLLQSTQIPTLFLDNQLRIKRFTHAATHLFHFIDADVGRPIGDLASRFEGDLMADLREVQRTLAVRERQVVLTDRSAVYLVRVLPYRRLDDVVDGLVVTFLDVTALNRALGERARLAGIVESSQDAIVGRSFDGTILTWNDAAERMFGYSANEALGSPMSLMVPPDGIAQVNEMHERVKLGESIPPFESVRLARDGRRIDVSVAISPIRDEAGHPVGASAIFRDISDLKRAQLALEQEAREKDQFLAILSHELRNPLAPIRTSLDLLRSGPGRQGADVALTIMDRQLSQLTSLVDQLLDAARMASGKIQLDLDDIDVVPLVAGVVQDHTRLIADAKLELKLSLPPPDAPLYVSADRLRLSQALSNLIGNAVKFTPREGTVTVGVYPDAAARSVTLSVRDTGIGIDAADKERLFRPFVQGDPKLRMHGGLGLGLALARSLVEAHGGRLDVRSEGAGRGAEFQISLPLLDGPRAHAARKRRPTEASTRRRVLIVEDNVDAAESLRQLLAAAGHEVETVADGAAALERIRQLRPEIVLCDVRLPGEIDGLRLAKTVRGGDGGFGNPYLVAVTGFGRPEHREETRSAGFDRHLTKPASAEAIDRLLGELPPRR
jgi:two-component system CheB/CheR fusion protein